MKKVLFLIAVTLCLAGCLGNTSSENDLIGQVKKAQHATPILLPNYSQVDVSLGVVRNGVGSMSREDVWLYVEDQTDFKKLETAAQTGAVVHIHYNVARFRFYVPNDYVTGVEIEQ